MDSTEDVARRTVDRRTAVRVLGGLALGAVATAYTEHVVSSVAHAAASCPPTPAQMEGPYYLDQARVRADITEGKPGVPLRLSLRVTDAGPSCTPIAGVDVDVWHCDALGIYSGYEGAAVAPTHVQPVNAERFLRGTQATDAAGDARFRTIYPGWYTGRTTHVHVKVHVGTQVVTTQLYFPEEVTKSVYRRAPYDRHPNRDTANDTDVALKGVAAKPLVMWNIAPDGDGYLATATIGVRL
jgi:protocatechuate 3,4-dioxygenase beta subunit